jgi:hypothetical protein
MISFKESAVQMNTIIRTFELDQNKLYRDLCGNQMRRSMIEDFVSKTGAILGVSVLTAKKAAEVPRPTSVTLGAAANAAIHTPSAASPTTASAPAHVSSGGTSSANNSPKQTSRVLQGQGSPVAAPASSFNTPAAPAPAAATSPFAAKTPISPFQMKQQGPVIGSSTASPTAAAQVPKQVITLSKDLRLGMFSFVWFCFVLFCFCFFLISNIFFLLLLLFSFFLHCRGMRSLGVHHSASYH